MAENDDELPPVMDPRIRDALLKNFQEIPPEVEAPREDFLSISVLFLVGAVVLLSFALWKGDETVRRREERVSMLPRPAGLRRDSLLESRAARSTEAQIRPTPSPPPGPPPAASPVATPSPTLPLSEYVEAVRMDDVCRVAEKSNTDSIGLLMALPEFRSLSLDAQALVQSASGATVADIRDGFRTSGTDWALLYEALLLGGLLEVSGEVDVPRAEQILQRLAGAYPENAAFAFYLLPILEKQGAQPDELDRWIERFAQGTTFDDGSRDVYREIRDRISTNASGNILALAAVAQLPTPSHAEPTRVILSRIRERDDLAPAVYEASQRFRMEEASSSTGVEYFDWSAMEVATFTNLAVNAWGLFSTEPFPIATAGPFVFQNFRDLLESQTRANPDLQNYYTLIENTYAGGVCDPDELRRAFERVRGL